jgi:formate C-acetyltransferase
MEFKAGKWQYHINVRDFIIRNYTPYDGDDSFLAPPTERTLALWNKVKALMDKERKNGGVLDIDEHTISTITSHKPGYIDKDLEIIVGLQTDEPLKRAIMPFGGIRMVRTSLEAYNRQMDPEVEKIFEYRKTHNDGVFDAYYRGYEKSAATRHHNRSADAYGRGRIIGDYRRVPLYGWII